MLLEDWESHLKEFEESLRSAGYSERTCHSYLADLRSFFHFTNNIDQVSLDDYLMYRSAQGASAVSINRFLSSFRHFLKFLEARGWPVPPMELPGFRVNRPIPRTLAERDVMVILNLPEHDEESIRDKALIWFLLGTGVRISEALSIRIEDVDFDRAATKVRGKGNKERMVYIPKRALKLLQRYMKVFGLEKGPLFVNLQRRPLTDRGARYLLARVSKRYGLSQVVHPHTLRHTFATRLLEEGAGLRDIQELLGHKSLRSTQIYTRVSPALVREAMEAMKKRRPIDEGSL
ncbi:tyrosine-type recombinase/integrase [Coprothermobacteraceae bacterium]|nr:tyrosine-type recombinase/integrase [Coprothermobacteraceae bacterium]